PTFPYTTLFRSIIASRGRDGADGDDDGLFLVEPCERSVDEIACERRTARRADADEHPFRVGIGAQLFKTFDDGGRVNIRAIASRAIKDVSAQRDYGEVGLGELELLLTPHGEEIP